MAKTKKKNYFGEVEEQAVVDYLKAETIGEKNRIYTKYLDAPIRQLVYSIIRTYPKFIGNCGIEELEELAYIHVYTAIQGFTPGIIGKSGQKVKAYSYLGTICNNYYKNHSKNAYKRESHNDEISAYNLDYVDQQIKDHYQPIELDKKDLLDQLIENVIINIEEILKTNKKLKVNEIKVGEAILILFKDYKTLFIDYDQPQFIEYTKRGKVKKTKFTNIYTKNRIFYIIRELTGLTKPDLIKSLLVYRKVYGDIKKLLLKE